MPVVNNSILATYVDKCVCGEGRLLGVCVCVCVVYPELEIIVPHPRGRTEMSMDRNTMRV